MHPQPLGTSEALFRIVLENLCSASVSAGGEFIQGYSRKLTKIIWAGKMSEGLVEEWVGASHSVGFKRGQFKE